MDTIAATLILPGDRIRIPVEYGTRMAWVTVTGHEHPRVGSDEHTLDYDLDGTAGRILADYADRFPIAYDA